MPSFKIPGWAQFVGAVVLGVAGGSFGAGMALGDRGRDITETRDAVKGLEPRVTTIELWKATQDERWLHLVKTLEEMRADLKEIKRK